MAVLLAIGCALGLILPGFTSPIFFPLRRPVPVPLKLEADSAAGKQPPLVDAPEFWLERKSGNDNSTYRINLSPAVFGMDVVKQVDTSQPWTTRLYPSFARAVRAAGANSRTPVLPSFAMLNQKAKAFGDDLLAAAELVLSSHPLAPGGGKNAFLQALAQAAAAADDGTPAAHQAVAFLAAAVELAGGTRMQLAAESAPLRDALLAEFAASRRSKAIGFYGDNNPALAAVFQRDRFLQKGLETAAALWLARLLEAQPALRTAYEQWLAIGSCITNPPARLAVADLFGRPALGADAKKLFQELAATPNGRRAALCHDDAEVIRFLPPAMSQEDALFSRLFARFPEIPGADLMSVLVAELRAGRVSLAPQPDSGFYDRQCYALEPLVCSEVQPEAAKLVLGKTYKETRLEAFKSALTKAREMQVKSFAETAGLGGGGHPPKPLSPEFRMEPVATAYLRTAQAHAWLEQELTRVLGPDLFQAITLRGKPAPEALRELRRLFTGYYLLVQEDLGMAPLATEPWLTGAEREVTLVAARAATASPDWFRQSDPDWERDVRCVVPIFTDASGTQSRYWLVCGVQFQRLSAEFLRPPYVGQGTGVPVVPVEAATYYLPVEVFAEATSHAVPPTRVEFRQLSDGCASADEIRTAMGRREVLDSRRWVLCGLVGLVLLAGLGGYAWHRRRRGARGAADVAGTAAGPAPALGWVRPYRVHVLAMLLVLGGSATLLRWQQLRTEFANAIAEHRTDAAMAMLDQHAGWLGLNTRLGIGGWCDTPHGFAARVKAEPALLARMRDAGADPEAGRPPDLE